MKPTCATCKWFDPQPDQVWRYSEPQPAPEGATMEQLMVHDIINQPFVIGCDSVDNGNGRCMGGPPSTGDQAFPIVNREDRYCGAYNALDAVDVFRMISDEPETHGVSGEALDAVRVAIDAMTEKPAK